MEQVKLSIIQVFFLLTGYFSTFFDSLGLIIWHKALAIFKSDIRESETILFALFKSDIRKSATILFRLRLIQLNGYFEH